MTTRTDVVGSGSVQAAADNLGLTSSAVSQHLAALQKETGLTLFHRVGGRPYFDALVTRFYDRVAEDEVLEVTEPVDLDPTAYPTVLHEMSETERL